jgi:hypothetical protein
MELCLALDSTLTFFCLIGWLLITSAPKKEIVHFSEMLSSVNQSTWNLNPKEHQQDRYHCEDLKLKCFAFVLQSGE